MPTPGSGAISMNDMRTHINRATSSSISMSEMRTRYGGSGSISFSDLRNCEGFTIDPVRVYVSGKLAQNTDGWATGYYPQGSISPNENNGRLQFADASFLVQVLEDNIFNTGTTQLLLTQNNSVSFGNGSQVTTGFKTTNITRVVLANTSRTITSATSNDNQSDAYISYDMPTSGTIHCLIKF